MKLEELENDWDFLLNIDDELKELSKLKK